MTRHIEIDAEQYRLQCEEIDELRRRVKELEAELDARVMPCDCNVVTQVLGDGCERCNPVLAFELKREAKS